MYHWSAETQTPDGPEKGHPGESADGLVQWGRRSAYKSAQEGCRLSAKMAREADTG